MNAHHVAACCAGLLLAAGCNAIFGVDDLHFDEPAGSGAAAGVGGGGTGGTGAGPACSDDEERSCYEGPAGTEGVGSCLAGTQRCMAGSWGPCTDQVLPQPVDCDNPEDIDCNGYACGEVLWSKSYGSVGEEYSATLALSAAGEVTLGGLFGGTISFGGDTYAPASERDGFLLTLAPDGQELWSMQLTSAGTATVVDVDVLTDGSLVACGGFRNELTLPGVPALTNGGNTDSFIVRLDPSGQVVWVEQITGGGSQFCNDVIVTADGAVTAWGHFNGNLDVGSFNAVAADTDSFIVRWDGDGVFQWARVVSSPGEERARGAVSVGDDIILVGSHGDSFSIDGFQVPHDGGTATDILVLKVNASGDVVWTQAFTGGGFDRALGVTQAANGDLLVAGYLQQDLLVDNQLLVSAGGSDALVVRLAADGSVLWSQSYGSSGQQRATHVAEGLDGDLYLAGWFEQEINLGGGPLLEQGGTSDIFLARLSADGDHRFSRAWSMSGTFDSDFFIHDDMRRLAVDPQGFVLLSSVYAGDLEDGGMPLYTAEGDADLFVAKLAP